MNIEWQQESPTKYSTELWNVRCEVTRNRGRWTAFIGTMFAGSFSDLGDAQSAIRQSAIDASPI
jgi:hypothetical protein